MIVLDTHVLLWAQFEPKRLGKKTRAMIERKWPDNEVCMSAISFWEIGVLAERKRIELSNGVSSWRKILLASGLMEVPVDGEIALRSLDLMTLHPDPADRFITATALCRQALLVTADSKLLDWNHPLERLDAGK